MPIVDSGSIPLGGSSSLAAGAIVVRQPSELRNALAQREKPIVIDNPKLERSLKRIEFWQGREGTYRFVALLMAALFALAFALQYRIDVN